MKNRQLLFRLIILLFLTIIINSCEQSEKSPHGHFHQVKLLNPQVYNTLDVSDNFLILNRYSAGRTYYNKDEYFKNNELIFIDALNDSYVTSEYNYINDTVFLNHQPRWVKIDSVCDLSFDGSCTNLVSVQIQKGYFEEVILDFYPYPIVSIGQSKMIDDSDKSFNSNSNYHIQLDFNNFLTQPKLLHEYFACNGCDSNENGVIIVADINTPIDLMDSVLFYIKKEVPKKNIFKLVNDTLLNNTGIIHYY